MSSDERLARRADGSEVIRLDAATLGAKIAAKEVSSTEATRACLDQIAETDEEVPRVSARGGGTGAGRGCPGGRRRGRR